MLNETPIVGRLDDWQSFLQSAFDSFSEAIADWRSDYDGLLATWNGLADSGESVGQANALCYQARALSSMTVIEALADRQFLPRYGFPINVQRLKVLELEEKKLKKLAVREEDRFRLERPGLLAIREYVPGSKLFAGGKIITSRGLQKHFAHQGADQPFGVRGSYAQCTNRHLCYDLQELPAVCPLCDSRWLQPLRRWLQPRHGYTTSVHERPTRSGRRNLTPVGYAERCTVSFRNLSGCRSEQNFAGVAGLAALYREDGEILVYNAGENDNGFCICTACGYAASERRGLIAGQLPTGFVGHRPLHRLGKEACAGPNPLRNQTLAAREPTDVLLLDFSGCPGVPASDEAVMTTLGYGLQIAGASLLGLDTRELGTLLTPAGPAGGTWGVVLHDNVPGGAGHVRELLDRGRDWLAAAAKQLHGDDTHHATCRTACLDCLLTFDAQQAMARGLLDRPRALAVLEPLLGGTAPSTSQREPAASSEESAHRDDADAASDLAARRARAAERLARRG